MASRAPDRNDNTQGWNDVPRGGQKTSSTSAQYAPKGKPKGVTASGFTQPGTPSDEKRWESDKKWWMDGQRQEATISNRIADKDRKDAGIATKDFGKGR